MTTLQSQWIVLALLLFSAVQSKKVCDFSDEKCMTKGGKLVYKKFIAGIQGLVEPADPMTIELIEGEAGTLKFKLTKPTLTGLSNCEVIRLACVPADKTFDYFLQCPHLKLSTEYESVGTYNTNDVSGQGIFTLTADDYVIKYKGTYDRFVSEDKVPRAIVGPFKVETEPKGKLMVEVPEFKGDRAQTDVAVKYLNENPAAIEKLMGRHVLDIFFTKLLQMHSEAWKTFSLEELVPAE